MSYLGGQGGAPRDQLEQAYMAVDPQQKMTPAERNIAVLGASYDFWTKKGRTREAAEASGSLIQAMRGYSTR